MFEGKQKYYMTTVLSISVPHFH